MKRYDFHPICLLFPRMTDEELQELAEDLRIKGLLHDIVLYEGKILDGATATLPVRWRAWSPGSPSGTAREVRWSG